MRVLVCMWGIFADNIENIIKANMSSNRDAVER